MKKIMGLVLGVALITVITGCQKKEAQAPAVEQPMVTESTAMMPANAESAVAPADAMAPAVTETVMAVEKPTAEQIQEALKNAGLYDGPIDGKVGPKTKKAIEEFQSQNGLTADGKVGAKTWSKLGTHLGASGTNMATEPIMPSDTSATGSTTN